MMDEPEHAGTREDEVAAVYGWTRSLAQRLDVGRADDLTHDALVAALQVGPRGPGLRHWLAAVLRTRNRDIRRAEARRSLREKHAARAETSERESAADSELTTRLELALAGLSAQGTEVLRLRFELGLQGEALAASLGCSPAASRQRLSRTLREVRAAMGSNAGRRTPAILSLLRSFTRRASGPMNPMHALLASSILVALTLPGLWSPEATLPSSIDATEAALGTGRSQDQHWEGIAKCTDCHTRRPPLPQPHGHGHAKCSDCHFEAPPPPKPRRRGHGEGRACVDCHTAESDLGPTTPFAAPDPSPESLLAKLYR